MILNSTQIAVLKAKSPQQPKVLTEALAVVAVAQLGGYLEHRRKTPIGIQVFWVEVTRPLRRMASRSDLTRKVRT